MNNIDLEKSIILENNKEQIKDVNRFNRQLRNIYEMIALGIPLNDETLHLYSINKDDIQELISNSILIDRGQNNIADNTTDNDIYVNKDQYIIKDLSKIYQYGIKFSADKQYYKATRCFYKCYEIDSNNREYCLRMLLVYLKENCLQKALSMLLHIETLEPEKYQNDNIIYLYLLNILIDCGERNIQKLQNLDPDTLMYNDKIKQIPEEQCNIRRAIYLNKFKYAYQLLIEYMNLHYDYSIESKLLRELLNQTVTKEETIKRKIKQLINREKYSDIIEIINELKKHRYLNSNEMYIYMLTESIINIKNTRIIPKVTITNTKYLYDAIKGNNFVKAKELNQEYLIKKSKDISIDPVNILLEKINNLILQIKLEPIEEDNVEIEMNEHIEINNIDESTNKELLFAEEIAYYIKSENLSIDYARKYLGIIPSQILLIKLIYARDYFIEGLDELGNRLLKEVEKSKDKTDEVNRFLNEIRRDKKFYKNRDNTIKVRRLTYNNR